MINPQKFPSSRACRQCGPCVDSDHPAIIQLAAELTDSQAAPLENAITLYYWTRDQIRYNPYALNMTVDGLKASTTLAAGQGWCVPKAILLAGLCRAIGIPARLGYADVRNHLSTARMRAAMDSDVFFYHGYTSLFLEDKWVKATPAFNIELCEKFGLRPMEFNGREDSLYHEFDVAGNRHMEYLNDRGEFAEVPLADIIAVFGQHYPGLVGGGSDAGPMADADWDADVAKETTAD